MLEEKVEPTKNACEEFDLDTEKGRVKRAICVLDDFYELRKKYRQHILKSRYYPLTSVAEANRKATKLANNKMEEKYDTNKGEAHETLENAPITYLKVMNGWAEKSYGKITGKNLSKEKD